MKNRNIDTIRKIINYIRTNNGKEELSSINPSDSLTQDIGFDSLDLAELTVRIEKEFNVDVFEDEIVSTVDEVLEKINE